jgi:hypothetical protein
MNSSNNDILNYLLTQKDYVNNSSIQNAFNYNRSLNEMQKKLINDYKSEMDPDDWGDKPLDITYTVINWILQQKSRQLDYKPDLIDSGVITEEQFMNQINNAQQLTNILSSFPTNKENIILYRGENNDFEKYFLSNVSQNQITLYSFLSTSTNLSVATNFSRGVLLCFLLPSSNPLPFISDVLTMNYNTNISDANTNSSESEVLLPLGCTFTLQGVFNNINVNGKILNVYYLKLLSFGPHKTRNFWPNYTKMAKQIYDKYTMEQQEGNNYMEAGKKKRRKRKTRKQRKQKLIKTKKQRKTKKQKSRKTMKFSKRRK